MAGEMRRPLPAAMGSSDFLFGMVSISEEDPERENIPSSS